MKITSLWLIGILSLQLSACAKDHKKTDVPDDPAKTSKPIRVLGYLFSDGNWQGDLQQVHLKQITDLNLAFINPEASGLLIAPAGLTQLIEKAHTANVRVFLSLGGGNPPAHLATLLADDAQRAKLATTLSSFASTYQLDGIDIDLEGSLIDAHYPPFVSRVATLLHQQGKLVTAALASWNANQIPDSTLRTFDFINSMSYDKTGPWNPSTPGQHAPYQMVVDDFTYYHSTRGIAAEKLFIGLPFYGYGFGTNAPESIFYRDLVKNYPGSETKDEVTVSGGGVIYYNGIPTIQKKVTFALDQGAGGVMVWQLLHDSDDEKSLLKAINDTIQNHKN
ncbi:Chitinase, GH18 family [bacterium A37T11]|nr:Chitinase, GH18 family [bacterium A37T11]